VARPAVTAASGAPVWPPGWRQYAGWIAGALAIVGVLAVGAGVWFSVHPP
jgi:hypothetical protein